MPFVDLCLSSSCSSGGEAGVRLGEPLLDAYLEFVAARCRPNTVLATAFDLKVFFTVVGKAPAEVTGADGRPAGQPPVGPSGAETLKMTGRAGPGGDHGNTDTPQHD